jgi:two-component system alkaline phosphatase synthesis response regulator PhoP
MAGELILLVDDEPNIIQLAQMYLEREGFSILSAGNGEEALETIRGKQPALVVLDVMLPSLDGFEICKMLRAEKNPVMIIMLTARDDDIDKIIGLELGADDYLTKPFNPRELVARVKALLRRNLRVEDDTAQMVIADLVIDPSRREVRVLGEEVGLRTQEFDLLLTLVKYRGHVLSREQILERAWGYTYFGQTRTVDVHVAQIRRKIAASQVRIETVTGIGYKLVS